MGIAPIPKSSRDSGAEASSGLSLLLEPPSGECLQVQVSRTPFVMGRLGDCDLTLRDKRISRRHARIQFENGSYSVQDLKSRHGVTVNGERVDSRALTVGDRIGFGVEDSFVITVGEEFTPHAPLLRKVSQISDDRSRTGALGRLAAMLDVARTMTSSEGVEEVFDAVVDAALTITHADRAFLLLRDEHHDLHVKAARDSVKPSGEAGELQVPLNVITEALDERADLFSMTIGPTGGLGVEDPTFDGRVDALSALCVPILRMRIGQDHETMVISAKDDTLGVLYMDTRNPDVHLAEDNQALLQALAIEISTVIENARLIEEEREKNRLDQELRIAQGIQESLRPAALPSGGWLVAKGHSEASWRLGGDYYDLMPGPSDNWVAVVADVSGKGVAASLLASLLQGAFFFGSGSDVSLAGTLSRINRYLCERSGQTRFVTVFALILEEDGTMRWSNAGHCSAILARASGAVQSLRSNCRPVGLFADAEFAEDSCQLFSGDKLLIYSDGVSEARSSTGELLGEQRLEEAAKEHARHGTAEFFDSMLATVRDFAGDGPHDDDLTMLALGFKEG